ncbi:MAG: protein translocase subunit SecF [Candidatus Parcubacteria bacterium]|nr:protein translocase subunit SecF [Candidatus Parcubacteria bacterium]
MFIIKHKYIFIGISAVLVVLSFASMYIFGVRYGIDFTGGSLLEAEYSLKAPSAATPIIVSEGVEVAPVSENVITPVVATTLPKISDVKEALVKDGINDAIVQPTGKSGYIIRTKSLSDTEHTKLLEVLSFGGTQQIVEKRFTSIGPVMGTELRSKAFVAVGGVILAIMLFIAFAFRKVSVPVSSSKYGVMVVISLMHDVIIPTGALAILGHFNPSFEADILFVTALLIILGFSVHDTIVVFDRIRENLKNKISLDFEKVVGASLQQTFVRSINTSLTLILVLVMLLVFGPASTYNFALILLIGVTMGTYSSIFLASPLLVVVEEYKRKHIPVVAANQNYQKKKK